MQLRLGSRGSCHAPGHLLHLQQGCGLRWHSTARTPELGGGGVGNGSPAWGEFAAVNGCHARRLRFPKLAPEWEALAQFAAELKG